MATDAPTLAIVLSATGVFDAAMARVIARAEELMSSHHVRRDSALEYLARLSADVRARIANAQAGPVDPSIASDPLFEPLLDAVVRELLHAPGAKGSGDATLEVLRIVSTLKAGSSAHTVNAEDLQTRLRAPDAFELLIEMAHDFRSPLTSILFLAETLRDGNSGPVNEIQRSQLGLMYSAAFGLASVASDVMDLARREKDLIEDHGEPYAISEVIESVQRLVNPIVEEKDLDLRVVLPARAQAYGHPHALSRVLLNLTTNALKFTDAGFVEVGVKQLPHGRLEFYVQDTGRGIPPQRRQELFQPFKRRLGGQEGHFFSGSGVGLSIARRLVEAMGSELTLESSDDQGTRFSFKVLAEPTR